MPYGTTIQPSHTCNLLLTDLPYQAQQAHILPGLVHSSLISVGQLCDNEYSVTFTHDKLLPLPQPPLRARTDARTNPSAQRATQLRRVLARVYAVSAQNQITTSVP
jgi:hypothetical protein